jgi:hypothetical protein
VDVVGSFTNGWTSLKKLLTFHDVGTYGQTNLSRIALELTGNLCDFKDVLLVFQFTVTNYYIIWTLSKNVKYYHFGGRVSIIESMKSNLTLAELSIKVDELNSDNKV